MRLSAVVAVRNDNYGGDFIERLKVFVWQLCRQWWAFEGQFELILVVWNPIEHETSVFDQLSFIKVPQNVTIRLIEVPTEVHQTFENSESIALFEYKAKNVGIRRALGQFILATNPDILFSERLMEFMCRTYKLESDCVYRTDRINFLGEVRTDVLPAENLEVARSTYHSEYSYQCDEYDRSKIATGGPVFENASGDFLLAHRDVWFKQRGYREWPTSSHTDYIFIYEAIEAGMLQHVLPSDLPVYHKRHHVDDRLQRPSTNVRDWRTLCARDDELTDRSNWGMADRDFEEQWL